MLVVDNTIEEREYLMRGFNGGIEVPILIEGYEDETPMTRPEAARYIGKSIQSLNNYALNGKGPKFFKLQGLHSAPSIYFASDLDKWIADHECRWENSNAWKGGNAPDCNL